MSTATIPFAARAAAPACLVETSVDGVLWDGKQQLNVTAEGTAWHTMPQAASSTDTNMDGQGDEVDDPYFASAS